MIKYIEIYQLPKQKYAEALKNMFNKNYDIDINDYKKVYKCILDIENINFSSNKELNIHIADVMFEYFNVGDGINSNNYNGRSFSVTDIIRIDDNYLLCESFGWKEFVVQ